MWSPSFCTRQVWRVHTPWKWKWYRLCHHNIIWIGRCIQSLGNNHCLHLVISWGRPRHRIGLDAGGKLCGWVVHCLLRFPWVFAKTGPAISPPYIRDLFPREASHNISPPRSLLTSYISCLFHLRIVNTSIYMYQTGPKFQCALMARDGEKPKRYMRLQEWQYHKEL